MRTTIDVDEEMLGKAFKFSNAETENDLIHEVLDFFIQHRNRHNLLELIEKIHLDKTYHHKQLRNQL